jgi:hypothetical protein
MNIKVSDLLSYKIQYFKKRTTATNFTAACHFSEKIICQLKKILTFAALKGALAQLARAFDWQSKGHRFDSVMLHQGRLFYDRLF